MLITELKVLGDSDKVYTITASPGEPATCTCKAFEFAPGKPCKHMRFALSQLGANA